MWMYTWMNEWKTSIPYFVSFFFLKWYTFYTCQQSLEGNEQSFLIRVTVGFKTLTCFHTDYKTSTPKLISSASNFLVRQISILMSKERD